MATYGMDPDEADRVVTLMQQAADQFVEQINTCNNQLKNVPWTGPDAVRFLPEFDSNAVPAVMNAAQLLKEYGGKLATHALEQRQASGEGGNT